VVVKQVNLKRKIGLGWIKLKILNNSVMITSLHSAENANWVHSYPAVLVLNIKQGINNNKEFYNYIFRQN